VNKFNFLFVFLFSVINLGVKSSSDSDLDQGGERALPQRVGSLQAWRSKLFNEGTPTMDTSGLDAIVRERRDRERKSRLQKSFQVSGANDDEEDPENGASIDMEMTLASGAPFISLSSSRRSVSPERESSENITLAAEGSDPTMTAPFLEELKLIRKRSVSDGPPLRKLDPSPFEEFPREKSAPSTLRLKEDLKERHSSTPPLTVSEPAPQKKSTSPKTPKAKKPQIGGSVTPNSLAQIDLMNAAEFMRAQQNLMGSVFGDKKSKKQKAKKGLAGFFARMSLGNRQHDSDEDS
jgi:hypothetical protein